MAPEEAEDFYEDDEDPREVFAAFDRGVKGVTAPPDAYEALARDPEVVAEAQRHKCTINVRFHPDVIADVHFYASMDDQKPADWVDKIVRQEIGRRISAEIDHEPEEVARLREARGQARRGETVRRTDG